jgi:hypothetical protein
MQAAHVVPMPPVSECMRWQESVSDEFVRPMHSVLSTKKPICLFGCAVWVYSRLAGKPGSPVSRYGIMTAVSVFMADQRALV